MYSWSRIKRVSFLCGYNRRTNTVRHLVEHKIDNQSRRHVVTASFSLHAKYEKVSRMHLRFHFPYMMRQFSHTNSKSCLAVSQWVHVLSAAHLSLFLATRCDFQCFSIFVIPSIIMHVICHYFSGDCSKCIRNIIGTLCGWWPCAGCRCDQSMENNALSREMWLYA